MSDLSAFKVSYRPVLVVKGRLPVNCSDFFGNEESHHLIAKAGDKWRIGEHDDERRCSIGPPQGTFFCVPAGRRTRRNEPMSSF